jgi:hypothetical protein
MSEWTFTESQWRAIARIEHLSGRFNGEEVVAKPLKKRVYASHFSDGSWYIVCWPDYPTYVGPPEPNFVIVDADSGLIAQWASDKAVALRDARRFLTSVPAPYLAEMRARFKGAMLERVAKTEADEAIRVAQQNKPYRKKISKRARAVFDASEGKCHYCKKVLSIDGKWHIEHKVPRALFGGSEQSNLAASCTPCNHAKRDKTDIEFAAHLASLTASASG